MKKNQVSLQTKRVSILGFLFLIFIITTARDSSFTSTSSILLSNYCVRHEYGHSVLNAIIFLVPSGR